MTYKCCCCHCRYFCQGEGNWNCNSWWREGNGLISFYFFGGVLRVGFLIGGSPAKTPDPTQPYIGGGRKQGGRARKIGAASLAVVAGRLFSL